MSNHERKELTLEEVVAALVSWRWKIAAIVFLTTGLGAAYLAVAPRVYRADALLQLDQSDPNRELRREGDIKALAGEFRKQTNAAAEIAVIRSRTLLGGVVDALRLDLVVRPRRFPTWEQWRAQPLTGALPLLFGGLSPPAVSAASVVDELTVPDALLDKPFTLIVATGGQFTLLDAEGTALAHGTTDAALDLTLPEGVVHLRVTPGAPARGYSVMRRSRVAAANELQKRLRMVEEGEHSGVIRISIDGTDRALTRAIVRTIVQSYEDIHAHWRSHDVMEALTYLEEQLPALDEQAKKAEAALSQFQQTNASLDLSGDGARLLDRITQLETDLASRRRDQESFTPFHPAHQRIEAEIAVLERQIAQLRVRIEQLPRLQEKAVDLARSANVTSELYAQLMRNVQELRIVKAAIASDVRVIDRGDVLPRPVKPNARLVILIAVLGGLSIGCAAALFQYLRRGFGYDPDDLEELLGLPVYATLPQVPRRRLLARAVPPVPNAPPVLALQAPGESAVEGLRGLRTWLNTGEFRRSQKGLLITGATPNVGKTFVSTNLAAVLASAGRRVLLIEADMRKGNMDRILHLPAAPGLTDFLDGRATTLAAITHAIGGFHCVLRGTPDPRCAELLLNGRFAQLLTAAYATYDDVVIDTPPILAVSDAVIVGEMVGSALLVARAGLSRADELLEAQKQLAQANIPLRGVVYNGVEEAHLGRYAYHYAYTPETT